MMRNTHDERIEQGSLTSSAQAVVQNGGRFHMAWGWYPKADKLEACYLMDGKSREAFTVWRCEAAGGQLPSLADAVPALSWHEREMSDLCGVHFEGHPKPNPLVLHAGAKPVRPPLSPGYAVKQAMEFQREPTAVPDIVGDDVQELPFGPVRADVMESAQFLFFYLGEHILHYQPRLFFKHRGMEKRFEGISADLGVVMAERVSGVGSVAHALAYCQAVEAACGCKVPARARALRVVLAELERLYNHLHYFGHLADTTTLKVGNAEGKILEERLKQINGRLTGSRFLRNVLVPGGLRRDLHVDALMLSDLGRIQREATGYLAELEKTTSYLDRLITTGHLSKEMAERQGATGPVERASGVNYDLRRDHPYAAYDDLNILVASHSGGDAHARALVRAAEVEASFAILLRGIATLPKGEIYAPCDPVPEAEGLGWSESPRGATFYAVHLDKKGALARVKIKSPSFSNWRVFQYTVRDSNMMDYAINEASFGLTIAGCDR